MLFVKTTKIMLANNVSGIRICYRYPVLRFDSLTLNSNQAISNVHNDKAL